MLRGHPAVQRWAQTDDVLQGALVRLLRALESIHPDSVREFIALASQQIRRELIDLARHYYGPEGIGANHASHPDPHAGPPDAPDPTASPDSLAEWREFHEKIEDLPDEEREVVSLIFYQGLTQAEAADLLQVAVRTVQRRWHAALVKLDKIFHGGISGV
jgi:RNA polymerase sigma-70 factor (ECF subfamily)